MLRKALNKLLRRDGEITKSVERSPGSEDVIYLRDRYPQYDIGRGSYGNIKIKKWGEGAKISIGNFCSFADGVVILLGGEHRSDWVTTYPFNILLRKTEEYIGHPRSKGDVTIGNDVWVGTEAMILSGVTIGDGAIIGARAVVAKDVAPYAIAVGNPARIIKTRFNDDQIAELRRIAWWRWDDEKIERYLPMLLSGAVEEFIAAAKLDTD